MAIPTLGLVYRVWDGTQYSISAANADGSNKVILSGANFVHPDLIRFVESRNRRWAAWADGGELHTAASVNLSSATTVVTTAKPLAVLAISEDGDKIAYQTRTTNNPMTAGADLYLLRVHDHSVKLLRSFRGPIITCLGDGAFDTSGERLIAIGCGSGKAAGLLLLNTNDGSIISEDDGFLAWPLQWAFSQDLATVWLIDESTSESDVVRYQVTTRSREILYRSPAWRQADGSVAPNLTGLPLSPDGTTLAFSRYAEDRVPEVYVIPSSGGLPTMLLKSSSYTRIESWSTDGKYLAISVDASTPTQRMRLIDPRIRTVTPVNTGSGYVEFLAWMVA